MERVTKLTAKQFMEATFNESDRYLKRPRIICFDGYTISMQGGTEFHYCTPRELCNEYLSLELGYPSIEDEIINSFKECENDNPTNCVYPYTPIEVVEQLIEKHGGIVGTINYDIVRNYKP